MKLKAMVTVDLNKNVTSQQRYNFDELLADKNWIKIKELTTTWRISFNDNITEEKAISTINLRICTAAEKVGIQKYEAAAMIGAASPTIFNNEGT